jgi:antitoxin PrlF
MSITKQPENIPVLEKFLNFIATDIQNNPQHVRAICSDLFNRVQHLVADVEFDINAPLSDEDE